MGKILMRIRAVDGSAPRQPALLLRPRGGEPRRLNAPSGLDGRLFRPGCSGYIPSILAVRWACDTRRCLIGGLICVRGCKCMPLEAPVGPHLPQGPPELKSVRSEALLAQ